MKSHWWTGAALATFAALTYFLFPGHTYLQQDSQIYVPILEHLWNPGVLTHDILVERPHVAFTIYDELAIALRWVTRAGFGTILAGEQIFFRALGLWGIYLIAMGVLRNRWQALLAAAVCSLGSEIAGPAVLIVEYEPTPRAFAIPLVFLGVGLITQKRFVWAGLAGAVAFLLHPPSSYPFWLLYAVLALWPGRPGGIWRGLIPLAAACAALLVFARLQPGVKESQEFFARVTPELERLQRMRASYNWVSTWWRAQTAEYLFLWAAGMAGLWRIRLLAPFELRFFLVGLPIIGVLSVPVSYVLLEGLKWALMPQLQPARAMLFVTAVAVLAAVLAGCIAAREKRWAEAFAWFVIAYMPAMHVRIDSLPSWSVVAVLIVLAGLAAAGAARPVIAIAAALAAYLLIPWSGVKNYPPLHTPELRALSDWARVATPPDAVFLFPDAGKSLDPGIFRSEALRAVYVDWKGGGQVNYLKELGEQWWERWQSAILAPFDAKNPEKYGGMGVNYLVVKPEHELTGEALFRNEKYAVYEAK